MDMNREKERDRTRRSDRPSRFSDAVRDRSNDRGHSDTKRLLISNIPYELRWTELKDLFKEKVGDVAFVELFEDENGKPRGCGVVEFSNSEATKKALSVMHRYELNGRKIVLKEESVGERNKSVSRNNKGPRRDDKDLNWVLNNSREPENFYTYGLSLQFLESINVQPPLVKRVFVANLDFKADRNKIKEVFKMAGKVRNIELALDKDGKSRGFAVIEYDHPVEAVQAISMFDRQMLYERRMTVRMDRGVSEKAELRLPDGLKSIGPGLGSNGEPLRDVVKSLPQSQQSSLGIGTAVTPLGTSILGAVPNAGVSLNGLGTGLSSNAMNANNSLGNSLSLQALNLTGLGALQNQLLQQSLTANDLATVLTAQANNANNLGMGNNDMGSNVLGNSNLGSNVMGSNTTMNSGHLSMVGNRNLGSGSGYGRDSNMNSGAGSGSGYGRDTNISNNLGSGSGYGRDTNNSSGGVRDKRSDMVVITNLPSTVTWQLIREKFSECGNVKFAEMTSTDTAIVRFHEEWDAERAIKMFDRTRIDGRTIDVRLF